MVFARKINKERVYRNSRGLDVPRLVRGTSRPQEFR